MSSLPKPVAAAPPVIAIVQVSESFQHIWIDMAAAARASPLVTTSASLDDTRVAAIVIAAGGLEAGAHEALRSSKRSQPATPVAVVGAVHSHRVALSLTRAGADEYFALPDDLNVLTRWLCEQVQQSTDALAAIHHAGYDYERIVGRSPALRSALTLASRVTPHAAANVLISGETGTGKELVAHAIHFNGPRAHAPFVDVNCAALPANLVESELFGFEAGAFTDAKCAKPGLLETANGGTLFLDEVGDLAFDTQAKLLRALDERRIRRLGATQATPLDVRIIAASHVDLAQGVADGRFREDLYYRLNVFNIHLPPLRDRGDDVLLLAEHFNTMLSQRYRVRPLTLDDSSRRLLLDHHWPGNVRELRNAVERAVVMGSCDALLPRRVESRQRAAGTIPFPADMEAIQQAAARGMLERCRGNKSAAAAALGISRKRLYALLHAAPDAVPATPHLSALRSPAFVQENVGASAALLLRGHLWDTLRD